MLLLLLHANMTFLVLLVFDADRGKLVRLMRQFTPYVWTEFDWRPTSSLTRWFSMLFIIFMVSNSVRTF